MKSLTKRWWFWLLIVIAGAFVIVHTYLAIWVRDYVNRKLSEIPGYRAQVAAVTLHLWRGAYQIHNIDIKKTSGKVPVPFFSAPLVDLSVQWHALIFEHAAVGNIEIHRAKMNLVNGPTPDTRQVEVDAPWAQKIKQLFPLKINRFAVHDGIIEVAPFFGVAVAFALDTVRLDRAIGAVDRQPPHPLPAAGAADEHGALAAVKAHRRPFAWHWDR